MQQPTTTTASPASLMIADAGSIGMSGQRGAIAAPSAICAIDVDNLLNCGSGGYARLNINAFCKRIFNELGGNCIIRAFANRMAHSVAEVWERAGANVTVVGRNVDPFMASWLDSYKTAHLVGIASGDHFFSGVARRHRERGGRVVVWSLRDRAAHELVFAASKINFDLEELLLSSGSQRVH